MDFELGRLRAGGGLSLQHMRLSFKRNMGMVRPGMNAMNIRIGPLWVYCNHNGGVDKSATWIARAFISPAIPAEMVVKALVPCVTSFILKR